MNFYSIQHSLNKKIMGNYPQVKEVIYYCDVDNEPLFIGNFYFEEIKVKPILANPVLYSKSKLTDLIYIWHVGFTYTKLISGKLKSILEKHKDNGLQFIQCRIFKDDVEYSDYWILNFFEANMEFIEIEKSVTLLRRRKPEGGTFLAELKFENLDEFNEKLITEELEGKLYFEKIRIEDKITKNFFSLRFVEGGMKQIVSEKLKKEIEGAGCTGIEFQPVELSYNEWTMPGGEREKIYGKV